jgi:hypothetical protein
MNTHVLLKLLVYYKFNSARTLSLHLRVTEIPEFSSRVHAFISDLETCSKHESLMRKRMSSRSRAVEKWAMPLFNYLISKIKLQAALLLYIYFSLKLKSTTPAPFACLIKINRSRIISKV